MFTRISFAYFGGKRKEEGMITTEGTEEEREGFQRRDSKGPQRAGKREQ
jgi:hypothetical protein